MINEKIKINNLEIMNRLVMAPMATWKRQGNSIPEELVEYYKERSGKIGLIICEYAYICEDGKSKETQLSIAKDEDIFELSKITKSVHQNSNTKIFAQINHAGKKNEVNLANELEIKQIINDFAAASRRAKQAGFDGVEIHSCHGFLLNQFYSPLKNKRNDNYSGKTLEGRVKIILEVIAAIKKEVGNTYPLSIRFGGCDYQDGGSTISDASSAAILFEKAGVNVISISGGVNGYIRQDEKSEGWFSDLSCELKKHINIPVILTGGIRTKKVANDLLRNKQTDFIGIGRPLLMQTQIIDDFIK